MTLNDYAEQCHTTSVTAGWRDSYVDRPPFGEKIALCHSELSEALEGDRKGLMDDHLPNRRMAEVELADALIRIFDLAGREGFDLEGAYHEKMLYNAHRQDHKRETRAGEGGKKY